MVRYSALALALGAFIYLAVAGVGWLKPRIEADLENRVAPALAEADLTGLAVGVVGRTVTLQGDVADAATHKEALTLAARVFGVAKVNDGLDYPGKPSASEVVAVAPAAAEAAAQPAVPSAPAPYTITVLKTAEGITLSGLVPDAATRTRLLDLAATHYGAENVQSALTVAAGAPAGWLSAVGALVFNVVNLEQASITVSATANVREVMVAGEGQDSTLVESARRAIESALPAGYKLAYAVDVVATTPVDETATPTTGALAKLEQLAAKVLPAAGAADQARASTADCASLTSVSKQSLLFGFDKAALTGPHHAVVKEVATALQACPEAAMTLAGYTDATGSPLYNQWLSEQRAISAKRGLVRNGVEASRLTTVGYGEKYPQSANTSKVGRAKNRRVDFVTEAGSLPAAANAEPQASITTIEFVQSKPASPTDTTGAWWERLNALLSQAASPSAVVSPSLE